MKRQTAVIFPTALVVVPTYNESLNILRLLTLIEQQQSSILKYTLEVLVVDDKSPDGTADIVKGFHSDTLHVRLISGDKNGLGAAYIRAFAYILDQLDPEIIIMMDADLSHDPATIPYMLDSIVNGADYVIGSRYNLGGMIPGNWPIRRIANSRVANWLAHHMLSIDNQITDMTGGFKAIRVSTLRKINLSKVEASGYVFQVSLLYAFAKIKANITEVPIKFADRQYGESKLSMKDIFEFIYRVAGMNYVAPFRVAVRYASVGLIGTFINILSLAAITGYLAWSPSLAVLVAIEISIISNFYMNHLFTFRHVRYQEIDQDVEKNPLFVSFLKFQLGAVSIAALSYALFLSFYHGLHINYILADAFSIAIGFVFGLAYNSRFVWRKQNA